MDGKLSGWLKDTYDPNDYLHTMRVTPVPEEWSNLDLLTPVRSQGQISSCYGQTMGNAVDGRKKRLGIFAERSSATWFYNGARYLAGTLAFDIGVHPRNALEWWRMQGTLLEQYWPYDMANFDSTAPSSLRQKQADLFANSAYFRVVDGIDGLCDALSSRHLVAFGCPWFEEWRPSPPCGILPVPTMSSVLAGGHGTLYHSYSKARGFYYGVNSWGLNWGDNGKYAMPFEAIDILKRRGGYDAHYLVFDAQIIENPPPAKPGCNPFGHWAQALEAIRRGQDK
jgi:hypothetical protein